MIKKFFFSVVLFCMITLAFSRPADEEFVHWLVVERLDNDFLGLIHCLSHNFYEYCTGIKKNIPKKVWTFLLGASCTSGLKLRNQEEFEQNIDKLKENVAAFLAGPAQNKISVYCALTYENKIKACINLLTKLHGILDEIKQEESKGSEEDIFTLLTDVMIMLDADSGWAIESDDKIYRSFDIYINWWRDRINTGWKDVTDLWMRDIRIKQKESFRIL